MTLINTNEVSFKNSKKTYLYKQFIIFLFSLLPLSLILGNTAITLNIIIIDLFFCLLVIIKKNGLGLKINIYIFLFLFGFI